jgi:hypothetical protein
MEGGAMLGFDPIDILAGMLEWLLQVIFKTGKK